MRSALPLIGIGVLMLLGFVVLVTALAYHPTLKPERTRDRALARARRRQQREPWNRRAAQASSAMRRALKAVVVRIGTHAIALAYEWSPRLRHHARKARTQWLTVESTGPVIAVVALSAVVGYLIARLG